MRAPKVTGLLEHSRAGIQTPRPLHSALGASPLAGLSPRVDRAAAAGAVPCISVGRKPSFWLAAVPGMALAKEILRFGPQQKSSLMFSKEAVF